MTKSKKESIIEVLGYKQIKNNEFCYVKWKYSKPSWENIKDIASHVHFDKFINTIAQISDAMKKQESEIKLQKHLNSLLLQHKQNTKNDEEKQKSVEIKDNKPTKVSFAKKEQTKTFEHRQEKNKFSTSQITNKRVSYNSNLVKVNEYDGLSKHDMSYKNKKIIENIQAKPLFAQQNVNQNLFGKSNRRYFHKIEPVVKPIIDTPKISNINEVNVFIQDQNVATLFDVININDNSCITLKNINLNKVTRLDNIVNFLFTARQNVSCLLLDIFRASLSKSMPVYDNWCNQIQSNNLCFVDDTNTNYVYFLYWSNKYCNLFNLNYEFLIFRVKKEYTNENFTLFSASKIYENNLQWNIGNFGFNNRLENYFILDFLENGIKNQSTFLLHGMEQNYITKYLYDFLIDSLFESRKTIEDIVDTVFVHEKCYDTVHLIPNIDKLLNAKTQFFIFGLTHSSKFLQPIFVNGGVLTVFDSFFATNIVMVDLYKLLCCIKDNTAWNLKISDKVHKKLHSLLYAGNYTQPFYLWLESCIENLQYEDEFTYFSQLILKYMNVKRHFYVLSDMNLGFRSKSVCEMLSIL